MAGNHIYPVYPSTINGDTDIFTHTILFEDSGLFADNFETGDTSSWSSVSGG